MEVKNDSGVKLTLRQKRALRYKKKKECTEQEIENGNAESKEEKGTCLEAQNVRSDLGAEQSSVSRKERKKMNGNNSLDDEKKTDSFSKEEANSLTNTLGNAGSVPGPKEGPAGSETKRKRSGKKKAQTNAESVLELKGKQENPLIDQNKLSDSHLEINKKLGILENVPELTDTLGNAGSEPGPKEGPAGSETKRKRSGKKKAQTNADSVLELKDKQENPLIDQNKVSDSHLEISKNLDILENVPELTDTLGNVGSEPGSKKGPAGSETKRKRSRKKKVQTKAESVLELKDKQENPLIDQNKVSDSHLEISKNLDILENVPGLVGDQLNESLGNAGSEPGPKEGPAGSEKKLKWKRRRKKKAQTNAESVLELKDTQENPLIDQNKVSDSHLEISKNLGILENVPELTDTLGNAGSDPGPKEGPAGSKTKRKRKKKKAQTNVESVLELKDKQENPLMDQNKVSDSHLVISKNLGILENVPGLVGDQLNESLGNAGSEPGPNEGPAGSEKKLKWKRKKKKAQTNAESGLELKDKQENPLIDQNKVSDPHLEISKNLGILANVPELTDTLGNAGLVPGPKEGLAGSETKRKRKRKKAQTNVESVLELKDKQENPLIDQIKVSDSHLEISNNLSILENVPGLVGDQLNESETKRKKKKRKRNKTKIGAIEDEDTSSKKNLKDNNNEAEIKNLSISEAVESNELVVQRNCISLPTPGKKLLILDLNGILVDVVQGTKKLKVKPRIIVNGKGVFKRPSCAEFLDFCFETFDVGIWSSRASKNVISVVNCIMGKQLRSKLLFCWCRKECTITKFKTLENKEKPLVFKELKKIWDKHVPGLPRKIGKYNESNTLLLDDSPYKALRNPANTAIFPHAYQYTDYKDRSLARGGDIREYLERLAAAENVQKFVEQNPFGQPAITEAHPHWDFYSKI